MKKISLLAIAVCSVANGWFAWADESPRARVLWSRVICREEGHYIGWPSVCRLKNGDLIAVFSGDRDHHVCPWGKVQMVRSTDGGETWSAPRTIANTINDDRDSGIVQLPDGEIFVTWFTSVTYQEAWKNHLNWDGWKELSEQEISFWKRHAAKLDPKAVEEGVGDFCVRSRDNGATWSAPEKLSDAYAQTPHGPIVLRDGSLLQFGRKMDRLDARAPSRIHTRITAARSTDAGHTWTELCHEVPMAAGEPRPTDLFHEPHVAELPDGTLVGMVRYHGRDDCMRQTVSRDGGKTWSPMAKTELLGLPPHLLLHSSGKLICVYGQRNESRGDRGDFAVLSDDGGKTWDAAHKVCLKPATTGDLGYPASTELADGKVLTVFYEDLNGKTVLYATKWEILR